MNFVFIKEAFMGDPKYAHNSKVGKQINYYKKIERRLQTLSYKVRTMTCKIKHPHVNIIYVLFSIHY